MRHPLLATCVIFALATLAAPAVAQIGGTTAKVVTYKAEKDATLKPVWDKAGQTLLPVWQKNKGATEFREGVLLLLSADNARKAKQ
jgi:hypothetical protein